MSSEMRELVRKWRSELLDLPEGSSVEAITARGLAKNYNCALTACADELEALLARTEAGPSLLCQSDACAHKGTAHNFCTPRTEAGADGAAMAALERESDKSMGVGFDQWFANPYTAVLLKSIAEDYVPRTHPQDASGDAERFAAVMNCQWLRSSKYGDQVLGWREEFLSRVNAEVVAMQAKEAK